mmetsp:Transcript_17960/g.41915  ORF Transcript_17960/g.41915 Transcript_17960/m.41915 type:complete len:216 (-) Transcript_17960:160-807(-)
MRRMRFSGELTLIPAVWICIAFCSTLAGQCAELVSQVPRSARSVKGQHSACFSAMDWQDLASKSGLQMKPLQEQDVAKLESAKKVTLPKSYRTFLTTIGTVPGPVYCSEVTNIGGQKLQLLKEADPELISIWLEGDDGDDEEWEGFTNSHLKSCLLISDLGESIVLLNPKKKTASGEWQAVIHNAWHPGARVWDSFGELLADVMSSEKEDDDAES